MDYFTQCCRLCTSDQNVSFTIYNLDSDGISFINKLEIVVPEIVDCKISLPNGLCTICAVHLNDTHKFIKQCLDTQIILKQRQLNEQLCRLCASNENISLTLSSMDSDNILISCKLEIIAGEIVKCNEKLSNCVCSICSVRLNEIYKFIGECFKSQGILKRYFKQQLQNSAYIKNELVDDTSSRLNNPNFETVFIEEEIINEEYIKLDLETDRNIKVEESLELENNTNFDTVCIKEEFNNENYVNLDLEHDTTNINIKFEERLKSESLDLHSEIIIKEENFDFANETDINSYQASRNTNKNNVVGSEENDKFANKEKSHKCTLCNKSYTDRSNLNKHIRIHTQEKPYKCKICPKAFNTSGYLKVHSRAHTKERPYKCEICEKAFNTSGYLRQHSLIHTQERPYKCEMCEKTFSQCVHLKRHIRYHKNERPHKCDRCDKAFFESGHLKTHIRSHTNERPFKCETCEKAFSHRENLQRHIRTHTNERLYKCEVCEKSFVENGHLKRHMVLHTNETSFKCNICERTFTHNGNLKKHMVSHKNELKAQI